MPSSLGHIAARANPRRGGAAPDRKFAASTIFAGQAGCMYGARFAMSCQAGRRGAVHQRDEFHPGRCTTAAGPAGRAPTSRCFNSSSFAGPELRIVESGLQGKRRETAPVGDFASGGHEIDSSVSALVIVRAAEFRAAASGRSAFQRAAARGSTPARGRCSNSDRRSGHDHSASERPRSADAGAPLQRKDRRG